MYKPIPPKGRLSRKADTAQQDKNGRKGARQQGVNEAGEAKRDPSISKKMEEKTSVERSSSIGPNRKGKTDKIIEQEYRVNRTKQMQKEAEKEEQCLELRCNSRESYKQLERDPPAPRLRLMRARSNDSLSRMLAGKAKQAENSAKLQTLQDQNAYLKQLHSQSLTKIQQLQKVKLQEKSEFEGEQKVYERQIQILRSKVDRNKVDIGHLFSYQSFDPTKLVVRPILEVEENSSILRSLYNTSGQSGIKRGYIQSQYGLYEHRIKKIATETTALSSQNYKDTAQFF